MYELKLKKENKKIKFVLTQNLKIVHFFVVVVVDGEKKILYATMLSTALGYYYLQKISTTKFAMKQNVTSFATMITKPINVKRGVRNKENLYSLVSASLFSFFYQGLFTC